jgi:hypothetical protein
MVKRSIEPGRRYREIRRGAFGGAAVTEWIVEGVEADLLGLRHARLVNAADLTERKTLSVRALADPTRFEEV